MRVAALAAAAGLALAGSAQAQTSVYTTLDASACRTLERNEEEGGWIVQRCPGPGGWALRLSEGDLRQTLDVIAPGGREYPLDFYSHVSDAFSTLGARAEWRGRAVRGRFQPSALIARYTVQGAGEDDLRNISWLVVARIDRDGACITGRVPPGPDQNARARRLADARGPCLGPRS